jgi:hypothetical protein
MTKKLRVHLTGESQGEVRVAPCKYVPDACMQFYLAEREREAAAVRERAAHKTKLYKDAAGLSKSDTGLLQLYGCFGKMSQTYC